MSLPKSLLAYEVQLEFMDRSMDLPAGGRMFFTDEAQAEHFRMRCNYARALHREENEKIHQPGTPLYGKSEYDILVFTIKHSADGVWVYAAKQIFPENNFEPIPEDDHAPPLDTTAIEIHRLENHSDDDKTPA